MSSRGELRAAGQTSPFGRLTARTLTLLAAAGVVLVALALNLVVELKAPGSLKHAFAWFTPNWEAYDSWRVMRIAYDWTQANGGSGLYQAVFFDQNLKFQYAPTSLLVFAVFDAFGGPPPIQLLNAINWTLVPLTALAVGAFVYLLLGRDQASASHRIAAAAIATAAAFIFYPVMRGFDLGQVQVWINFLFVCAAIAWIAERRAAAGVLIGLICLLKPQFGLFLLWGLIRREWRFSIAMVATGAVGLAFSIALFGFGNHLEYLSVLQHISRHGEAFWPNQSVNGLLQRLTDNFPAGGFVEGAFPPYNPVVYYGTLASSAALVALALWPKRARNSSASLFDLLLAGVAFTAASPVAWEHHYGVMIVGLAALFAVSLSRTGRRNLFSDLVLAACYLAAAIFAPVIYWYPSGPLSYLTFYLLVAAIGVLVLLWRQTRPGGSPARNIDATPL